jgi:hypothetical protein
MARDQHFIATTIPAIWIAGAMTDNYWKIGVG